MDDTLQKFFFMEKIFSVSNEINPVLVALILGYQLMKDRQKTFANPSKTTDEKK